MSDVFPVILDHGVLEIKLSHFPYRRSRSEKFWPYRLEDDSQSWLLHGHVHSRDKIIGERMIHVGVDAWDYRPVSLHEIKEILGDKGGKT